MKNFDTGAMAMPWRTSAKLSIGSLHAKRRQIGTPTRSRPRASSSRGASLTGKPMTQWASRSAGEARHSVALDIVAAGDQRRLDVDDAPRDQTRILQPADAHDDVIALADRIEWPVGELQLEVEIGVTVEKFGHVRADHVAPDGVMRGDLEQPRRMALISGDLGLGIGRPPRPSPGNGRAGAGRSRSTRRRASSAR